jgi:uncharacterized DUF497 family protein
VHTDDDFEWDPEKAEANWQKHGVSFLDGQEAFFDRRAITKENPFPFEERFSLIGTDVSGRVLSVVFTWRSNRIRIISARRATAGERRQYEGE